MKKIVALLPMKAHSERIPRKNMALFHGRPLYHRVVEALLKCKYVETVAIDTDNAEIVADVSKNFKGITIIERPESLRGDFVSMNDVIAYDLSVTEGEHYVQTHSTNPLLKAETIAEAIVSYFESMDKYDSLFSVTGLQERLYSKDGLPINHDPQELLRTQDMEPYFIENSNFYIFSKNSFMSAGGRRIGNKSMMFIMDKLEAIDIDNPEDWMVAEVLWGRLHEEIKCQGRK